MWNPVQKLFSAGNNGKTPPAVPLRKPSLALSSLAIGSSIQFSSHCPLPELTNKSASIIAARHYRFGADHFKSFQLQIGTAKYLYLTIAEDSQGHYLSFSRALHELEQDAWFGRDALGFFTEQSTAKTIRCKIDLNEQGEWAAARYSKTVDWVEGTVAQSESARARIFHYNLLVDESGEKALEIEHDDMNGENRVFITVYRPVDDIASIDAAESPVLTIVEKAPEPETTAPVNQPKQRPDFRRLMEQEGMPIHIERTPLLESEPEPDASEPALPAFLLEPKPYLSLDEVIPPDSERVRVSLSVARGLIDRAQTRNVRVRDVLRDMLGLESALSEEVMFELPLSDEDYRTLAMRFKIRPDHRAEIRARLEQELKRLLIKN